MHTYLVIEAWLGSDLVTGELIKPVPVFGYEAEGIAATRLIRRITTLLKEKKEKTLLKEKKV